MYARREHARVPISQTPFIKCYTKHRTKQKFIRKCSVPSYYLRVGFNAKTFYCLIKSGSSEREKLSSSARERQKCFRRTASSRTVYYSHFSRARLWRHTRLKRFAYDDGDDFRRSFSWYYTVADRTQKTARSEFSNARCVGRKRTTRNFSRAYCVCWLSAKLTGVVLRLRPLHSLSFFFL